MDKIVEKVTLQGVTISGEFFSWEEIGISKEGYSIDSGWIEFDDWAWDKWGRDFWCGSNQKQITTETIFAYQEGVSNTEDIGLSVVEKVEKYGIEIPSAILKASSRNEIWTDMRDDDLSSSRFVKATTTTHIKVLVDKCLDDKDIIFFMVGGGYKENILMGNYPSFFAISREDAVKSAIDLEASTRCRVIDIEDFGSLEDMDTFIQEGYKVIHNS